MYLYQYTSPVFMYSIYKHRSFVAALKLTEPLRHFTLFRWSFVQSSKNISSIL